MAPRSTAHQNSATAEPDDNVASLDSVVDFDLDAGEDDYEGYPPFRVRLGGQTFTIEQPDAGLVMEIEKAPTSEAFFALAFDDQWPTVRPLLENVKDPTKLHKLARQFGDHFGLNNDRIMENMAPNREERRRQRRRAGRR